MSTYAIKEVPPTADGSTRFALASTPAGMNSTPAKTLALVYGKLLAARQAEAVPDIPPPKPIRFRQVLLPDPADPEAGYRVRERGEIVRVPTVAASTSGKFTSIEISAATLDKLFLGDPATIRDLRDSAAYECLKSLCDALKPSLPELRLLNDALACVLALRRGVEVKRADLPVFGERA